MSDEFDPVTPWPMPVRADCAFYTCMDFGDETIEGVNWDIRARFAEYVGHYPLAGKTVLDVGTASGFLAFSAEAAGATVTVLDALHAREFNRVPFRGTGFSDERAAWVVQTQAYLSALKNSFWYGWHRNRSKAEAVYAPVANLWRWERTFDVVIAGAIVEHISDPVSFLGALGGLAREAVIVAFTPVLPSDEIILQAMNKWDDPALNYSWFQLSLGTYRQIFANLGFTIELLPAKALCNEIVPPQLIERPTIVARRVR